MKEENVMDARERAERGAPQSGTGGGDDADVLIVGLGPVGLTLGNLLGQAGVRVLILERETVPYGLPRAVGVDDEALRVFQSIGLDDELAEKLILDVTAQFVLPSGKLLGSFAPRRSPFWERSAYCFFYQPHLEHTLREGLRRFPNVDVRIGHEVVALAQDDRGVAVSYRRAETDGTLRARWVVGCDGGRSVVRQACGIRMSGANYPEPWLVVDLRLDPAEVRHLPYFNFYCDPVRPQLSCPQPGGHHRFEFMLLPGETKEEMEKLETVRRLIARFVDPDKVEVLRRLVYTFNALTADQWRDRRVLLAGDAAHMTPQFFGQGMNSGIRDASNLAWKLLLVLAGRASSALLDSYASERKRHVEEMIAVSLRIGRFVSLRTPAKVALRNALVGAAVRIPALRRYVSELRFKPSPSYATGSYYGLPRTRRRGAEGELFIQPTLRSIGGGHVRLDDALGTGFALVGWRVDPRAGLDAADRKLWSELGTRWLRVFPDGGRPQGDGARSLPDADVLELEDVSSALGRWIRTHAGSAAQRRGAIVVLRPDRYVFAVAAPADLARITAEARTRLLAEVRK
jgi:3-(3-hydroxy-phenyl)propionate hydroxylase